MKSYILTILTTIIFITSYGQDKKDLTVSFSSGLLTSPYYNDVRKGGYYSFDMDYYFRQRHILSSNFTSGGHDYDEVLSNVPSSENFSNGRALYKIYSFIYKYKIVDKKKFTVVGGAGAGIMTHTRDYWRQDVNSSYRWQLAWSDLVFPVRLEANYKLSRRFQFGVLGGFYIQPDYPILGYHAGPRLSYVIK